MYNKIERGCKNKQSYYTYGNCPSTVEDIVIACCSLMCDEISEPQMLSGHVMFVQSLWS